MSRVASFKDGWPKEHRFTSARPISKRFDGSITGSGNRAVNCIFNILRMLQVSTELSINRRSVEKTILLGNKGARRTGCPPGHPEDIRGCAGTTWTGFKIGPFEAVLRRKYGQSESRG